MGNAAPSWPAPALAEPRAKPLPRREQREDRDGCAPWFRAWCEARNISTRDLAAILEVTQAVAQQKLRGEKPVTLNDLKRFPPKFRHELFYEFGAWCSGHSVSHF